MHFMYLYIPAALFIGSIQKYSFAQQMKDGNIEKMSMKE